MDRGYLGRSIAAMPAPFDQRFVGREAELALLETFLERGVSGPQVLLIEGDPGMGKTELWRAGLEAASRRSWRVLAARPTDAEAMLGYAGLGDLLDEAVDDALAVLPAPQHRALQVALLREEPDGGAPDARTVAVAFLNTLRALAASGPVLVAVDDVQWLDPASAASLSFAIRRLHDEPIGILLAQRTDDGGQERSALGDALAGEHVVRISVGPLDLAQLSQLLGSRLDVTFPRPTLKRIHAASGGNPFFALQLGRALGRDPADHATDLRLPAQLMSLLGQQLSALPDDTQDALAVASALAQPTVDLLTRVVGESAATLIGPAVGAHIVELDDRRIRFTHPLWAVAARSRTPAARQREIHRALALIVADPEARARHLALAAVGPDEDVAAALDKAARLAGERGAGGAAVELAGLARQLTPDDRPDDLRRRALAEAGYLMFVGDPVRARGIIETVLATCPPGAARGAALVLLCVTITQVDWRLALEIGRQALAEPELDDRVRMRCEGVVTAILDQLGEDVGEAVAHGYAELDLAKRLGDDVHLATALRGIARNEQRMTGRMPIALIDQAIALEPAVRNVRSIAEWPSIFLAEMLSWTDDLVAGIAKWEELRRLAIERGEEHWLGYHAAALVTYECVAGDWRQALGRAEEALELAREASQLATVAEIMATRAFVEAHLGDEEAVRRDANEAIRLGAPVGARVAERMAAWALGLLELSLGNPSAAHVQLEPIVASRRAAGVGEPGDLRFVPDEIEALVGIGQLDQAEAMLEWFEGLAETSGRMHAMAAAGRCRGLLHAARAEIDLALLDFEAARRQYQTIHEPFGSARTLLALGMIERRRHHKRAARATLEAAIAAFEALGARIWIQASVAELGRIGGRASSRDTLTPSEQKVASLVAEGKTNREVAAVLYLTERTIEGHLSQVYAKLGIRSRSELAHRLDVEAEPPR